MRQSSHTKQRNFGSAVIYLLTLAASCTGGYMIGGAIGSLFTDTDLPPFFVIAILAITACVAVVGHILLHEAGHLVCGLISGYRFSSFRIGSLMWIRENGKVRLKRFSLAGTAGQCLLEPPAMVNGRIPYILYNLGGSIANLIATVVAVAGYFVFRNAAILSTACLIAAFIGAILALSNGIPMKTKMISNDGYNAITLGNDPAALRAFWAQMMISAAQTRGSRLKDLPSEWFVADENAMHNPMVATIAVFAGNRQMDEHRFAEADALMTRLLEDDDVALIGFYRHALLCDRLYCELIGDNRPDVIDGFLSKEQRAFMQSMKKHPAILRVEYAYALLHEHDADKAATIKAQFRKTEKTHPCAGDWQSEYELIDIVDKKAQIRSCI